MSRQPPALDEVLQLVGLVYAAALKPNELPRALSVFNTAVEGTFTQLYTVDRKSRAVLNSMMNGESPSIAAHEAYVREWGSKDPRVGMVTRLRAGGVFRCSEHIDAAFVKHDSFYQEFLLPSGLRWALGGAFDSGQGTSTIVGNARAVDAPSYEPWTATLLAQLLPHFQRATLIGKRLDQHALAESNATAVMQAIPVASLLTDWHGHHVFANHLMTDVFTELQASTRGRCVRFESAELQGSWIKGVRDVLTHGLPKTIVCDASRAYAWKISLIPWRSMIANTDVYESRLVLSTFEANGGRAAAEIGPVVGSASLSEAEQRVIALILEGLSAKEIARRRDTSHNTVRTQIASILNKTGCVSQKALVATLSRQRSK